MTIIQLQSLTKTQRRVVMQKIKKSISLTTFEVAAKANVSQALVFHVYAGINCNERVLKVLLDHLPEDFWNRKEDHGRVNTTAK